MSTLTAPATGEVPEKEEAPIGVEALHQTNNTTPSYHTEVSNQVETLTDSLTKHIGPAVLLPIPFGQKGPKLKGWQKLTLEDMTQEHLATLEGGNVGVLLGVASEGLCSIDCDSDEFLEEFLSVNPELRASFISKGERGGNVWVRITNEHPKTLKVKTAEGSPWGEFRADGGQTVIHGKHPSGCDYSHNSKNVEKLRFEQIQWPAGLQLPWNKVEKTTSVVAPSVEYTANDAGRAQRFVDRFFDDVRYVHGRRIWFAWDGGRWRPDSDGAITRLALQLSHEMLAEVATLLADAAKRGASKAEMDQLYRLQKEPLDCGDRNNIRDFLELAKVDKRIFLPSSKLDQDNWIAAAPNGVVDLRTGECREYSREDYTTRELDCAIDPSAACPRWEQFMEEVIPDPAVRRFLHKAAGYSLTGNTREQVFFFLHGSGKNGKSVLTKTLSRIFGSYCQGIGKGITTANDRGDYPEPQVAALEGLRFGCSSETGQGERMNEGVIKDLCGEDSLTGRRLYKDQVTFQPILKLWIFGNHKPAIKGTDFGIWRRVRLIPFLENFEGRADENLTETLKGEASGILNWVIQGCLLWQLEGLKAPAAIIEAVKEYQTEQDTLADFIEEAVEKSIGGGGVNHAELYKAYEVFCAANGTRYPVQKKKLITMLKERGWTSRRLKSERNHWSDFVLRIQYR